MSKKTKADRKAAADRLRNAREALAASDSSNYQQRNDAVLEAEKAVPFGTLRGWDYHDPND